MSFIFATLAVHNILETAIAQQWLPQGFTLVQAATLLANKYPNLGSFLPSSTFQFVSSQPLLAASTNMSLHLLLPRAIFFAAAGSLALAILTAATSPASRVETSFALGGTILAVLLLISNTATPLLALIGIVQAVVLTHLVIGPKKKVSGGNLLCKAAAIAGLYAALQMQAFFVTGHLCEFAGLQYTAGFVGYEEFDLLRSGSLVALDAFGGMILVTLALIPAAAALNTKNNTNTNNTADGPAPSDIVATSSKLEGEDPKIKRRVWREIQNDVRVLVSILLLFGVARAAATFCATLSAGIQRRHLYAWALFGPKFAFEVLFLGVTDVVLIAIGKWTSEQ